MWTKHHLVLLILLVVVLPSLASEESQQDSFIEYGPYVLPKYGQYAQFTRKAEGFIEIKEAQGEPLAFEGVSLRVITDLGVLIPEFQGFKRDDGQLLKVFSHMVPDPNKSLGLVVKELGWGHSVLYLFKAIHDALGRIYVGKSTSPPLADGRELIVRGPLRDVTLTIRAFSSKADFNKHATRAVGSSGEGYWDPRNKEIGIYIDKKLFHWAGYQAKWNWEHQINYIVFLRRYINRLVIRQIGHEFFHAIQQHTDCDYYLSPFLCEGTALYVQENLIHREENVLLSQAQSQIDPTLESHRLAMSLATRQRTHLMGPGSYGGIERLVTAEKFIRERRDFSVTEALVERNVRFYRRRTEELKTIYNVAYAFVFFLMQAKIDVVNVWTEVFREVVDIGTVRNQSAASLIDDEFRNWLENLADKWWRKPGRKQEFILTRSLLTDTINATDPNSANVLIAGFLSQRMKGLWPDNPSCPLYRGDIFWRTVEPFTAYDYYRLAEDMSITGEMQEWRTRVLSRLGDAYEKLGDIHTALNYYNRVLDDPPEDPKILMMYYRTKLKCLLYRDIVPEEKWREQETYKRSDLVYKTFVMWVFKRYSEYDRRGEYKEAKEYLEAEFARLRKVLMEVR